MSYLSDIEIAQAHTMQPIADIAAQCGGAVLGESRFAVQFAWVRRQ